MPTSSDITLSTSRLAPQRNWQVLLRFIGDLWMVRRFFLFILLFILIASATPQIYLWYLGEAVNCGMDRLTIASQGGGCRLPLLNIEVPITMLGLFILAGIGIIARITAWLGFEVLGSLSTATLHDRMIASLAATRTTFFDEHPTGHLLNRILGDFGNLRLMGVIRLGDSLNAVVEVLAVGVLVAFISPVPALGIFPALLAFYYIQRQIGPMLGHAQELMSEAKGEVIHRQTDLIEGRSLFNLYRTETYLLDRLRAGYEQYVHVFIFSAKMQAWLRALVQAVSTAFSFIVLIFVSVAINSEIVTLTLAAVIVSALFNLSGSFGWLGWCASYLTETLGNARRVYEFVDLPPETATEFSRPRSSKQNHSRHLEGDITFNHLTASYKAGLEPVLRDCNLTITYGKKIGIVGKTGAGKSSIVQALFRMLHVLEGDIRVGPHSIYDTDINTVRTQFGMVPQNPYLFAGSLLDNIDRFHLRTKADVQSVIERVGLDFSVHHQIAEGGSNLSVGQKQLVCLARILLKNHPFIILDEPTSAVDSETDQRIKEILHSHLAQKTVITIAHRLDTLREYDEIVAIHAGSVIRHETASAFFD